MHSMDLEDICNNVSKFCQYLNDLQCDYGWTYGGVRALCVLLSLGRNFVRDCRISGAIMSSPISFLAHFSKFDTIYIYFFSLKKLLNSERKCETSPFYCILNDAHLLIFFFIFVAFG